MNLGQLVKTIHTYIQDLRFNPKHTQKINLKYKDKQLPYFSVVLKEKKSALIHIWYYFLLTIFFSSPMSIIYILKVNKWGVLSSNFGPYI